MPDEEGGHNRKPQGKALVPASDLEEQLQKLSHPPSPVEERKAGRESQPEQGGPPNSSSSQLTPHPQGHWQKVKKQERRRRARYPEPKSHGSRWGAGERKSALDRAFLSQYGDAYNDIEVASAQQHIFTQTVSIEQDNG